jgi:hypothetical protein
VGSGGEVRGCRMVRREVVMEWEEVGIGGERVGDNGFTIFVLRIPWNQGKTQLALATGSELEHPCNTFKSCYLIHNGKS